MYEEIVKSLRDESARCAYRISVSQENQRKLENFERTIDSCSSNVQRCSDVIEGIKPVLAATQDYITEKSKNGLLSINRALALAGDVIPDSIRGVQFKQESGKAWLEVDGRDVDSMEGSGYKGASSMFIQAMLVKQNPNILQTIIFDEPLAKVSTDNSVAVSACLPYLCKDLQVILIEQKKEVYANFEHDEYKFFKDENGSRVEKVHVGGGTDEIS